MSLFVAVCGVIRFRTRLRLLHTPPLNLIDPSMAFLLLATLPSRDFQYLLLSYTDRRPSGTALRTRRTSKSQLFFPHAQVRHTPVTV